MKLFTYRNGNVKTRTHYRANMRADEVRRLMEVSDEWKLVEVQGDQAVFKSVKP